MKYISICVIAIALIVGCSGSSETGGYVPKPPEKMTPVSVEAGKEGTLYPFAVGNSWTYAYSRAIQRGTQTAKQSADMTIKVTKVEPISNGQRATMSILMNGKPEGTQVWISNDKGIFQVSIGGSTITTFNPPLTAIQFPVEDNARFSWKGTGGGAKMASNSVIVGSTEVDSEMKRFAAIQVDTKYSSVSGGKTTRAEQNVWFVPGIGIVRLRDSSKGPNEASELLLSLKSYTVK